jgi:hypothetical protein
MATSLASGSSEVLMRIGVLASGRGSNLEALLAANLDIVLVVANHPTARALLVAADHGVPTAVLARSAFPDAGARDEAIGEALRAARIELAVLAGYDQMLRPGYFAAYGGRTINIHPSLLPRHGGVGMMGAAVHRCWPPETAKRASRSTRSPRSWMRGRSCPRRGSRSCRGTTPMASLRACWQSSIGSWSPPSVTSQPRAGRWRHPRGDPTA